MCSCYAYLELGARVIVINEISKGYAFANASETITRLHKDGIIDEATDLLFCAYLLEKTGVVAVLSSTFGIDNHFRISFAAADDLLKKAIRWYNHFMTKSNFDKVLTQLRDSSNSESGKGTDFEKLMCKALRCLPNYKDRFKSVVRWTNWDLHVGADTGIDLVAEIAEENGGGFCAIQCKCYQSGHYISKENIDSFIAKSGQTFHDKNGKKINFKERLVIATTNQWTSNAEDGIKRQTPPITRLGLIDLQNADIEWGDLKKRAPKSTHKLKKIRAHQIAAKDAVLKKFKGGGGRNTRQINHGLRFGQNVYCFKNC